MRRTLAIGVSAALAAASLAAALATSQGRSPASAEVKSKLPLESVGEGRRAAALLRRQRLGVRRARDDLG